MVDWEVTATTIFCDDVDDEVTIIVNRDGKASCTGAQKYGKNNKNALKELAKKSKQTGKKLACKDPNCETLNKYQKALLNKK
jgi:TATA-box binding protein (TBP) (component of TFIID and TFIIIB)